MYYPRSENKGADQLRGYREADLRLCFCICKKPVFRISHDAAHIIFTAKKGSSEPCYHVFLELETGEENKQVQIPVSNIKVLKYRHTQTNAFIIIF